MALSTIQVLSKSFVQSHLPLISTGLAKFHNSPTSYAWNKDKKEPSKFIGYNKIIYPPQSPDEVPRPAVSNFNLIVKNVSIVPFC
jgi:hypothetical protein